MNKRFCTKEMEDAIIASGYVADRISLNSLRQVRKVEGRIPYMRPIFLNGMKTYQRRYRQVRWDSAGRAFRRSDNKRQREYDLPLES